MFLEIETGLTVAALALALTVPRVGSRWFEAIEQSFGKLARRRGLSVLTVGLTALALRAALLPILPIPQPLAGDEFAYLLGADTFAQGRLTNPTPPMWTHFESLAVLMKPTYSSKYPPAQSLFLAGGQVLMGHPFWGVWLSVGLMCAAITWMLQAWIGEGWALLGGFFAVIRLGTFSYWANSYWGGAVAALGGALVLGALPRVKQKHRVRYALLMGVGLAILANSRPYEGLVFSLPIAVVLLVWMLGRGRPRFSVSLRRVVLPLCLLLGVTAAGMGYYNWRVTGSPLKLPYQVYQAQYDPTPYFLWQRQKPLPAYRHAEIKEWEVDMELDPFRASKTTACLCLNELRKALLLWLFYGGPMFSLLIVVALVTLPYGFSWKDVSRSTKFLFLLLGTSLAGIALEVYFFPHYAAPMTCLFVAVELLALRTLKKWRIRGKPSGLFMVRSAAVITLALLLFRAGLTNPPLCGGFLQWTPWFSSRDMFPRAGRGAVLTRLRRQRGRQLVLVRYAAGLWDPVLHESGPWPPMGVWEWVYNSADIGKQQVVWAQDMGPVKNEQLIQYFKHRHAWLLYADDHPPKLVPYSETAAGNPLAAAENRR